MAVRSNIYHYRFARERYPQNHRSRSFCAVIDNRLTRASINSQSHRVQRTGYGRRQRNGSPQFSPGSTHSGWKSLSARLLENSEDARIITCDTLRERMFELSSLPSPILVLVQYIYLISIQHYIGVIVISLEILRNFRDTLTYNIPSIYYTKITATLKYLKQKENRVKILLLIALIILILILLKWNKFRCQNFGIGNKKTFR